MVRRICVFLLLCILPVLSCVCAQGEQRVFDECNLFTLEEEQTMQAVIDDIRQKYQMDFVVLTTDSTPWDPSDSCNKILSWADEYYDSHNFGMGQDQAGMLYLIDMHNRVPIISTSGAMIDYMTDHRLNELFEASQSFLATGEYGYAALRVLVSTHHMLQQGREEGQFRYDSETGVRITAPLHLLQDSEILFSFGAGLAVSLILLITVYKRYHLKISTYRYDYNQNVQRHLLTDDQVYIGQSVQRIRHTSGSSGSGGSRSSSGRGSSVRGRHGGGRGGRF